jgi:hypothetical protein
MGLWRDSASVMGGESDHYKAKGGTVHLGTASSIGSGYFVAKCNGRTQRGKQCEDDVTCKRCEQL